MMAGFVIACVIGGHIADKRGKILILAIGSSLMCLGAGLFSIAPSFNWTIIASLLTGIGGGFSEGMSMAVVSDNTSEKNRTLALNISQIVFCAGAVGTPTAVGVLISHGILWRWAYAGASIACAAAFVLAFIAYKIVVEKHLTQSQESHIPLKSIIRSPLVIALSVSLMIYVGAECGFANWIAVYFKEQLSAGASYSANMVAMFWGGIAVGRGLTAVTSRYMSNEAIVVWAFLSGAIFLGITLLIHIILPASALVFFAGVAYGPSWPTILSVAGERFKNQTGSVFGVIVASGSIGAMIFPAVVGISSDITSLRVALWVCPAISLVGAAIFLRLWKDKRRTAIE